MGETERCSESWDLWKDLPRDVLVTVLSRLTKTDLLRSARFVCSSWHRITVDPQLWRTIELRCSRHDAEECSSMEILCRRAVDFSSGQLLHITIDGFATDRLLTYISRRSGQMTHLRLLRSPKISSHAFCEAIANLPLLEELEIVNVPGLKSTALKAVARHCPRLKTLKFNCQGQQFWTGLTQDLEDKANEQAYTIGRNFPDLQTLELVSNEITDAGVAVILDGCPSLDSLDLQGCWHVRLTRDGLGERFGRSMIKDLRVTLDYLNRGDIVLMADWGGTLCGFIKSYP